MLYLKQSSVNKKQILNAAWAYQYSSQHTSIYILFLSYWFTLDVYICLILFDIIFSIMRYWHEIWVQYKHLLLFLLQWLCRVVFWWCCNTGNYILYHHYCISIHYTHIIHYPCIFLFWWQRINCDNFKSLDFVPPQY